MVPYLAGKEPARAYVNRVRDFAPVYSWIEAHTSTRGADPDPRREPDATTSTGRRIAAGNLDGPRIAAWLAQFPNADALRTELRRQHVTHVLLHPAWMRAPKTMMEREYTLDLPPQTNAVLRLLLRTVDAGLSGSELSLLFAVSPVCDPIDLRVVKIDPDSSAYLFGGEPRRSTTYTGQLSTS